MATSHAPLRVEAPEEGSEGQGYDSSQEVLDRVQAISRPRLREKAKRISDVAPKGGDAEEMTRLQERITLIPEAPRDKTQEVVDAAVVARYDRLYREQVDLDAEMHARLIRAEVPYDQYRQAITQPVLVTRHEVLGRGELSFATLARKYRDLDERLQTENQKYKLACFRLGLITEDVPFRGKAKTQTPEHHQDSFSQAHEVLTRLVERQLVEREPLTLVSAGKMHRDAVKAIQKLEIPLAEQPQRAVVRAHLLSIKRLYQKLEAPIDELRVSLLREIEEIALEVGLAEQRSETDKVALYKEQMRKLIKHTANLFVLDDTQDPKEMADARERYHLVHAWYKKLKSWMEEDKSLDASKVTHVDSLKPEVERLRRQAYPKGPVMSELALDVLAHPSEH